MQKSYKNLKYRILFSLIVVVIIIAGVRLYDDVVAHNQEINQKTNLVEKQFRILFSNELSRVHNYLLGRLNGFEKQEFMNYFALKDRKKLLEESNIRFKIIKKEMPDIKQMHFFEAGSTTFLRVHKPQKFGDYLGEKRPIIGTADKKKKVMSGFSFGLHDKGNLTYRVVKPIFHNGEYIGLLELGYDFKNVLKKINKTISEFYEIKNFSRHEILIRKDLLKLHQNRFDISVDDFVLNYKPSNGLDKIFKKYIEKDSDIVRLKDSVYHIVVLDKLLKDFQGNQAGIILSVHNMTDEYKKYDKRILQAIIKPIIVLLILSTVFLFIFNKFVKDSITVSNRKNLILNAQKNIVVVTNGEHIIEANSTFLNFFGYKNLEEFMEHYNCICDKFLQGENENYLQKIDKNGKLWSDLVIDDNTVSHRALIEDKDGKKHIFEVKGSKILIDGVKEEVLVFNDITVLEKQKKEVIEQDKIISDQLKMVQMGEMIGNIAHQWRQPLSVISTSASGLLIKEEHGMLNDGDIEKYCENIVNNSNYLSETIDTFRDFLKEDKEERVVKVQDRIDTALEIIKDSLDNNHIKLVKNIIEEPIEKNLVVGELSQVIINIVNNAKDVLIEKVDDNRVIEIELKLEDDKIIISIEDNAGGIPEDILPRIFDPYFTTKHQSQGTGLGLHMSYKIITESLKGNLYAQNTKKGAKFFIELPKD